MPKDVKKDLFNKYVIALILIFILNAFLKWRFFCGLVMADDFSYGVYAYRLFRIPLPWDMSIDFRMLRFSFLVPVSILYKFLPTVELTAVLFPMALSFGTVFLVYLIGKKLYGPLAGVFAALIIATFPADVLYGTMLLPDIVVPFYLTFAVWAFFNAESASGKKAKIWYVISGFSVFLSFIARENSYYFLLFYLPFIFDKKRWEKGLYLIGIGFALPVLMLYTFYYFKSGDFLYNLHLAQKHRDPLIKSGYIPKNADNWYTQFYYMFPFFFRKVAGKKFLFSDLYGLAFFLGVPCLVYCAIKSLKKHNWNFVFVLWWFLICYLFLEFGTISFRNYQMMKKLPRFLLILTPALALGYGVVLSDIFSVVRRKIKKAKRLTFSIVPGSVLIGIIIILQFFSLFGVIVPRKMRMDANVAKFRWTYNDVFKDLPHKPVYITGGWWLNKLSFFFLPDLRYADVNWDRSEILRDLKEVKSSSEISGSYIIIDRSHFNGNNDLRVRHSYDSFGSYMQLPPPEWKFLGNNYKVEIYEIPDGWEYMEPDGREIALGAFKHGIEINDIMLAFNNLHPDFISSFTRNQFWNFIISFKDFSPEKRKELYEKRVQFKESNGKWKIIFDLNKG
ncbi:MAG TPA: hypothetical protein ENH82_02480 [bacterium]|nr:hypothetical protein [bacterium]